jgi:hypothetical protein
MRGYLIFSYLMCVVGLGFILYAAVNIFKK